VLPINDPIGGGPKKRHGHLVNVDLDRVTRLAYESRDYVVGKSGFILPSI
jgi:hypothetical protein